MSSSTSMYYGYGFEVDQVTTKNIMDFIKNHQLTLCIYPRECEMFIALHDEDEGILSYDDPNEFFEDWDYSCNVSGQEGLGAVISNVISRETGVRVEFQKGQDDCGSVPTVLLLETSPWNYNEKEKNLTLDSLIELLLPYAKELGIDKDDIGFVSIEYYG